MLRTDGRRNTENYICSSILSLRNGRKHTSKVYRNIYIVGFEDLIAISMKSMGFWIVTLCISEKARFLQEHNVSVFKDEELAKKS